MMVGGRLSAQAEPAAREASADLPGVHLWFTDSGGRGAPVETISMR